MRMPKKRAVIAPHWRVSWQVGRAKFIHPLPSGIPPSGCGIVSQASNALAL
ncbi:hypothetical protein J122_778 [Marinobacter excellens LAMA 842]|uniref:Uncharacterized protein n=1 Tax=Marinobacter excellens LAMA 842 TaxID=1306954 RepID=A0A137SE24_9GAMM|nr:hypothetical protein J122_1285 [Marinobacter excellens LAMA 842]KXO11334.1 hypothetical protein J122_778 [Marinobacter excellens LAMA 842]